MKIDAREFPGLCRDATRLRALLLYGPDAGLVRERGEALARSAAGTLDDPFRFIELTRPDAGTLALEATAIAFGGGRRVLRVREAADSLAGALPALCRDAEGSLIILEAGELTPRSKLRAWAEKDQRAGALACYPEEGAALKTTLRGLFEAEGVTASGEALDWLAARLGGDRGLVRAEALKLALYVGEGGVIDMAAIEAVVADQSDLSAEDALYAATRGAVGEAERAAAIALAEGATPVGLIRAAHGHMDRLAQLAALRSTGAGPQEAVKALRPPVFFRRERALIEAAGLWSEAAVGAAQRALREAEIQCKSTGLPAEAVAHGAIIALARRAQRLRGR